MSDTHTFITDSGETIYACSPIEYIKRANAREHRTRHEVDLKDFIAYLMPRIDVSTNIPNETLDEIIAAYLDTVEPKVS